MTKQFKDLPALSAMIDAGIIPAQIPNGDGTFKTVNINAALLAAYVFGVGGIGGAQSVYATTAAGITGTTSGNFFFIPSASSNGSLDIYKNSAGTAVYQSTMPNAPAALTAGGVILSMPPETGYAAGMVDSQGRPSWLVTLDGTFTPLKIAFPNGGVSAGIPAAMNPETNALLAWVDPNGEICLTVEPTGWLYPRGLKIPQGAQVDDQLGTTLASRILGIPIGQQFQACPLESGYAFAVVDSVGRIGFGITIAGDAFVPNVTAFAVTAARENPNWIVQGFTDASGKHQLRSIRKADGLVTTLTTLGNNVDPILTSDNELLFATDSSGTLADVYMSPAGGPIYPLTGTANITIWGNSLTAGTGATAGNDYGSLVAAANPARTVNKYGVPGQTSAQILARQSSSPTLLTVTGNSIPASSSALAVTGYTQDIFLNALVHTAGSFTGTLAGVHGTLAGDSSGNYTFTPTTAPASPVACPANSPFVLDIGIASVNDITFYEVGRNDFVVNGFNSSSAAQCQANIAAAVAWQQPYAKRFLVFSTLTAVNEYIGSANSIPITAHNAVLASLYGNRYVDLTSPPTTAEMTALGYTPTSQDTTDIAGGVIPTGMRNGSDPVHLNNIGYALWNLRIEAKLSPKGW